MARSSGDAKSAAARQRRSRRGKNLSRKDIFESHRKAWEVKKKKIDAEKQLAKKAKVERIQKQHNKRANKAFDRATLQIVQDGLTEAITTLQEKVTPLSLFMAAHMAASRSTEKSTQIPYMLAIMSACVPQLSQAMLQHQLQPVFQLCEQLIAENATSNYLIVTKAMKLAQSMLLGLALPTMEALRHFQRLEPSKLQVDVMKLYLTTFRKLLEQSALMPAQTAAPVHPRRDPASGAFVLTPLQLFYVHALPHFVDLCIANFADAPATLTASTTAELCQLLSRSLSPYIVESKEGRLMLDGLLSHQLLSLLKPAYQRYWGMALEILTALFDRVSYVKRLQPISTFAGAEVAELEAEAGARVHGVAGTAPAMSFTERFPSTVFLLKVLNKLRGMDESTLNGKVERTMVALGNGMSVREFVEVLPFDPVAAHTAETRGDENSDALWNTSYTLNVLRRIASHDSLPFFVDHFFPFIQYCSRRAAESEKENQSDEFVRWSALLTQYWRVAVGFCHHPVVVTNGAFRDVARQLVGLLSSPAFVDTSATAIHILCDSYFTLSRTAQDDDDNYEDEDEMEDTDAVEAPHATGASPHVAVKSAFAATTGTLDGDLRERDRAHPRGASHFRRIERRHKDALDEDDYFLSMNDAGWNPHRYHNISQTYAAHVCTDVFAKFSANIMPRLCNVFETHDSTAVLMAIQSFSKVCSPAVMTTILKGILDVGANITAQATAKAAAAEEEEALAAGGGSGSGSAAAPAKKAGNAPLTSKRRVVLDIACAVVAQIPSEHVTVIFEQVVEPVLLDPAPESRLLQKKAYKLLFAMFENRIKDVAPLFSRIIGLLSVSRHHITISGLKMRIRCLSWALDACKLFQPDDLVATIRQSVGEVVLFSREQSSETRAMAMEVIEKMQRYMAAAGQPVNALLHLVVAGLSGQTPAMVASAVVCMAKIVFLTHAQLPEKDLNAAVALGFQLMESSMIEVRSAAAVFARMALKLMRRSPPVGVAVEKSLSRLLFSIALVTSQPRVSSNTRMQLRILLEKCIQQFGYDRIDPVFPLGSKNFLRYTEKMRRREEKKATQELRKRDEQQQNEFDQLFLGMTVNTADEDAAGEDLLEAGALTSFVSKHSAPPLPGFGLHALGTATGDDGNEDVQDDYDTMHLDFQPDGKLRIISKDEKTFEEDIKRRRAMADRLLRRNHGLINSDALNANANSRPGKRTRAEDEDFENEELMLRYGSKQTEASVARALPVVGGSANGSGKVVGPSAQQIERLRDQKAVRQELKRQRVEEDIRKGEEFQGRGTGDVRRGNVEPFAYVPLNRRFMNRRNARQALHRFEVVSSKHLKGEKAKTAELAKKR